MSHFFAIARARLLELRPPDNSGRVTFEVIARARPTLRVLEIPIVFRDRERGRSKMSLGVAFRCLWFWMLAVFRRALDQGTMASKPSSEGDGWKPSLLESEACPQAADLIPLNLYGPQRSFYHLGFSHRPWYRLDCETIN